MLGVLIGQGVVDRFTALFGTDPVVLALVGGTVIAGLNLVGALLIVVWRNPSTEALDGALGFAAGVMLAASFTSLILPGVERGGLLPVTVGIAFGALLLDRADAWVPHVHVLVTGHRRGDREQVRGDGSTIGPHGVPAAGTPEDAREDGPDNGTPAVSGSAGAASAILFAVAVTIHNMPEGLAVGVGFGSGRIGDAIALMLAIGVQNVPEGLAVSVAVRNAGMGSLWYAAVTGIRAGLVEVPLAVLGAWGVSVVEPVLPYAMGFAAGGMLYVILDEIVPETHVHGNERVATLGAVVGVVVMLSLDLVLAG